jgi:hypothetical protein
MLAFIDVEARVPADHPLRTIKTLADQALAALSPEFDKMYAQAAALHPARAFAQVLAAHRPLLRALRARLL